MFERGVFGMLFFIIFLSVISTVTLWHTKRKSALNAVKDSAEAVLVNLFAAIIVLLLVPLEGDLKFTNNLTSWVLLIIACAFCTIHIWSITPVARNLTAIQISVLRQVLPIFMVLIGFVFRKELFSFSKLIATLLIVAGNIMILYKKSNKIIEYKYILLGIGSILCISIAQAIDVDLHTYFNMALYVSLVLGIPAIFLFWGDRTLKLHNIQIELQKNFKNILYAGIALGLQTYFTLKSYQIGGEIAKIAPLLSISVLVNVFYEMAIQKYKKQKHETLKSIALKLTVSAMIIFAIYIMTLD